METFTSIFNTVSAIGAILMFALGIVTLAVALGAKNSSGPFALFLKPKVLLLGFLVSLAAVLGSLVYSNVIGYAPCELCWIQRIFIYPQLVLYAIALWKRDRAVLKYALALSLIGLIVALYHNWIDFGGTQLIACDTAVSCTKRYVAEFGFVTIPFMSLSALLALVGISALGNKHS